MKLSDSSELLRAAQEITSLTGALPPSWQNLAGPATPPQPRLEDEDEEEDDEKEDKGKDKPDPGLAAKLLKSRTIMIYGEINQKVAAAVTAQLLVMSDEDEKEPIKIFINSQGGHVESGDTIFDMIRFVKAPVKIIGTGWVASAGALIFAAAEKEHRLSLPNTRFMLHQPMGGVRGQASDISIEAQEILKMRQRLNQTFADQCSQPLERIEKDTERNFWMSANEAKDYGLVGEVIQNAKDV
ncbi:MAG: ATP-dependent Clp protease proteolytic subunit [Verrucomicrobiota bacterium]